MLDVLSIKAKKQSNWKAIDEVLSKKVTSEQWEIFQAINNLRLEMNKLIENGMNVTNAFKKATDPDEA